MATDTKCRRTTRRHRIAIRSDARVEFVHPQPNGMRCSFRLLDISVSGLSFALDEPLPGAEIGSSIDGATLHLGACTIQGDMMIMHVTEERGVCGALFYPASDTDLVKLKSAMAGIESVQG